MGTKAERVGWNWTLPLLVLTAVAVRFVAFTGLGIIPRDGVTYVEIARAVAADGPAAAFCSGQHPLFPLLAGLMGGSEAAATLLAIVAGALGVLPAFALGNRFSGRRAGIVAAALYAVAPGVARYAAAPLSEGLFLPLFLLSAERATATNPTGREGILAGLAGGLAYLVRPEGLFLAAILSPALLLRRRFPALLLFLVGFAAVGGPYAAWLSLDSGRPRLSPKKQVLPILRTSEGFERELAERRARSGIERPGPGEAALDSLRTLGEATTWFLLPMAVAGAIVLVRRRPELRAGLLTIGLLALLVLAVRYRVLVVHGYLGRRHMAPVVALILPLAAVGLLLPAGRRWLIATLAVIGLLLAVTVKPRDGDKITLKAAGRFIAAESGKGRTIATLGTPRIPYYAGGTDLAMQDLEIETPEEVRRALEAADWLALVPGRISEPAAGVLNQATRHLPSRDIGDGKWRVRLFRLR